MVLPRILPPDSAFVSLPPRTLIFISARDGDKLDGWWLVVETTYN